LNWIVSSLLKRWGSHHWGYSCISFETGRERRPLPRENKFQYFFTQQGRERKQKYQMMWGGILSFHFWSLTFLHWEDLFCFTVFMLRLFRHLTSSISKPISFFESHRTFQWTRFYQTSASNKPVDYFFSFTRNILFVFFTSDLNSHSQRIGFSLKCIIDLTIIFLLIL
jgi:hypothetical protein